MNEAGFARGKIAGAVIVGSAGTAATATTDKAAMDNEQSELRPDMVVVVVVTCVMIDYGSQGSTESNKYERPRTPQTCSAKASLNLMAIAQTSYCQRQRMDCLKQESGHQGSCRSVESGTGLASTGMATRHLGGSVAR